MWHNWSGEHSCQPQQKFYPQSVDQVCDVVRLAKSTSTTIRAVGQGHSFSNITATDGYMLYTDHLNKVTLGPELSEAKYGRCHYTVRAGPGATVQEIDTLLEKHGLVIGSNILLTSVRIGGIVATGSHGTGSEYSTISDRVYEISIVDADGTVRVYNEEQVDDEIMSAARVNLGLLGITTEIVLRVEVAGLVETTSQLMPVKSVFDADCLRNYLNNFSWLEFYWFPFSDQVLVKHSNRSSKPVADTGTHGWLRRWLLASCGWLGGSQPWIAKKLFYVRYLLESLFTLLMALMGGYLFQLNEDSWPNKVAKAVTGYSFRGSELVHFAGSNNFFFFSLFTRVQSLRYAVHYTTFIDYTPKVYNPECVIVFERNTDGHEKAAAAIAAAQQLVNHYWYDKKIEDKRVEGKKATGSQTNNDGNNRQDAYTRGGMVPAIFGLNVRFTATSSCLLSPAYAADNRDNKLAMWIEFVTGPKADGCREFVDDFNELMITKFGGNVHWPKTWYLRDAEMLRSNNKARLSRFMAIRGQLQVDSSASIFMTPTLSTIFDC